MHHLRYSASGPRPFILRSLLQVKYSSEPSLQLLRTAITDRSIFCLIYDYAGIVLGILSSYQYNVQPINILRSISDCLLRCSYASLFFPIPRLPLQSPPRLVNNHKHTTDAFQLLGSKPLLTLNKSTVHYEVIHNSTAPLSLIRHSRHSAIYCLLHNYMR